MSENEAPDLVIARFQDYFGRRSFWQRRLWAPGTVMLLQEAAEAADMFQRGLLREGLLKQLASSATIQAGSDLGLGGPGTRNSIRQALATLATEPRIAKYQLDLLVEDAPTSYLTNWHREFEKNPAAKPTENISRLVAGHLLGLGFSPEKLHRWSRWLEKGRRPASVAEILDEASTIAAAVARTWTVLVPVLSLGRYEQEMPVEWLNASETANWLVERGHSGVERHNGGFLLDAHALDPWSAVEIVSDELESLSARLTVGTVGAVSFRLTGVAYVEGQSTTFSLDRPRRQVDVPSLMRQDSLFRIKSPALAGRLRSAIDLAAPLETGAPGAAVAGGWAAIEAILAKPNAPNVSAADDLATLIACSFPRAELTALSYAYQKLGYDDQLSQDLANADSNWQRSVLLADALASGASRPFVYRSDQAAVERMKDLLSDPSNVLKRVKAYVQEPIRRLYRQRNLVLHAGEMNSVAMVTALRTAPPLVGAGLDRLVHDALAIGEADPHRLVAKARLAIEMASAKDGPHIADLLGH